MSWERAEGEIRLGRAGRTVRSSSSRQQQHRAGRCEERAGEIKYYDILFYPMEIILDKFIHSEVFFFQPYSFVFFFAVVLKVELLDVLPEAQPTSQPAVLLV